MAWFDGLIVVSSLRGHFLRWFRQFVLFVLSGKGVGEGVVRVRVWLQKLQGPFSEFSCAFLLRFLPAWETREVLVLCAFTSRAEKPWGVWCRPIRIYAPLSIWGCG
jgi:hypothetical protein